MSAESYSSRATEALLLARSSASIEDRSAYLEIAERWSVLAARTGRDPVSENAARPKPPAR